jgi:hypothetical protein
VHEEWVRAVRLRNEVTEGEVRCWSRDRDGGRPHRRAAEHSSSSSRTEVSLDTSQDVTG